MNMKSAITMMSPVTALGGLEWMRVLATWDVNEETDLAGYSIVYRVPPGEVWINHEDCDSLPVINGRTGRMLRAPITGLEYHVAIVAYDLNGNRSEPSEQVIVINTADKTAHVIAPTPAVNVCPKAPLPQK